MPEILIRYDDDTDQMPAEAIAAIAHAAGKHLTVSELTWVRDDDQDDEPADEVVHIVPNLEGLNRAMANALRFAPFGPMR